MSASRNASRHLHADLAWVQSMDSAVAGADLAVKYPAQERLPEQAQVSVPAGRWRVRAFHTSGDFPWVGIVQLIPA